MRSSTEPWMNSTFFVEMPVEIVDDLSTWMTIKQQI
jgi:hypothetical protein